MTGHGLLDAMNSHPLRRPLNEEMHMRRPESVALPMQMLQVVSLFGSGGAAEANRHLRLVIPADQAFSETSKYHRCKLGTLDLIWERHTEFASCTFIAPGRPADLFSMEPFEEIDRQWLAGMPGQLIRSTRLALVEPDDAPDSAELQGYFSASSLVHCLLRDSKSELFSDFRLHEEGCGRVLLVVRGLEGSEPAQTVQWVQELGNYRKLALLGLPDAQRGMVELDALEVRLGTATQAIAEEGSPADQLLPVISKLSAELAALTAATRYRMYASAAYGELVEDRLRSLRVSAIPGFATLEDFTERRLLPALRTCASFQRRLDDLAARAESATALLRTKVDTALAAQNRDLLESMNRRAIAQLRLQETVEGLSIVAVSYYAFGLFKAWVEPFHDRLGETTANWINLAAVPLIVAGVWLTLRRARRRWAREVTVDDSKSN
jgi:uncharacterized membrane-anchored protein